MQRPWDERCIVVAVHVLSVTTFVGVFLVTVYAGGVASLLLSVVIVVAVVATYYGYYTAAEARAASHRRTSLGAEVEQPLVWVHYTSDGDVKT